MYIKDELLNPYAIEVTERSFNVKELKGNNKKGEEVWEVYGYYSSFYQALRKIAFLKNISENETLSLSEYVERYESITKQLIEVIKE